MNWLEKLILPKWCKETHEMFNTPLTEAEKEEFKNTKTEEKNNTDWVTPAAFTGM